jgi:hypothetical protein
MFYATTAKRVRRGAEREREREREGGGGLEIKCNANFYAQYILNRQWKIVQTDLTKKNLEKKMTEWQSGSSYEN